MNSIKKFWRGIKVDPKTVKEFGFILTGFLGIVLPLVANGMAMLFFKESFRYSWKWPVAAGIALAINLFWPKGMQIIYRVAMFVASGIGWVMLRILLPIMYYLVITPLSLGMRLAGKDVLDQKLDRKAVSYWKKRDPKPNRSQYEKMF